MFLNFFYLTWMYFQDFLFWFSLVFFLFFLFCFVFFLQLIGKVLFPFLGICLFISLFKKKTLIRKILITYSHLELEMSLWWFPCFNEMTIDSRVHRSLLHNGLIILISWAAAEASINYFLFPYVFQIFRLL